MNRRRSRPGRRILFAALPPVKRDAYSMVDRPVLRWLVRRYEYGLADHQEAKLRSFGPVTVDGPSGPVPGHRFQLRYPGGWEDSTFEFWTDEGLVPLRLKMFAGEGQLEYRLVEYQVHDSELLPRRHSQ